MSSKVDFRVKFDVAFWARKSRTPMIYRMFGKAFTTLKLLATDITFVMAGD